MVIPIRFLKCIQCSPSYFSHFIVGNLRPAFTRCSLQGEVWSEVYHGARGRLTRNPLIAFCFQLSRQPSIHERYHLREELEGKEG